MYQLASSAATVPKCCCVYSCDLDYEGLNMDLIRIQSIPVTLGRYGEILFFCVSPSTSSQVGDTCKAIVTLQHWHNLGVLPAILTPRAPLPTRGARELLVDLAGLSPVPGILAFRGPSDVPDLLDLSPKSG